MRDLDHSDDINIDLPEAEEMSDIDRQTDKVRRIMRPPPREEGRIIILALLLNEISWFAFRTPLKTDRMHHSIRGVKMTPTSRR